MPENESQESHISKQRGWKHPRDPRLPLLLSLEAPTGSNLLLQPCSSRHVFMRPQIGQEKIWLLCFLLSPGTTLHPPLPLQSGHSAYRKEGNKGGPQHLPETDALASLAGACGPGEGGRADRWMGMALRAAGPPSFTFL